MPIVWDINHRKSLSALVDRKHSRSGECSVEDMRLKRSAICKSNADAGLDGCSQASNVYDVVIVGNGPSAIALSYFLSGNWPYYNGLPHPDPLLNDRLKYAGRESSLLEQDLELLSDGLYDSRSRNPVSVLFDRLHHPNADLLCHTPSVLSWEHDEERSLKHLVLGLGSAGGAWHRMNYSQLSLSLKDWLELPGLPFKTWLQEHNARSRVKPCNLPKFFREDGVHRDRSTTSHVALYYSDYVERVGLSKNFRNNIKVTSVKRIGPNCPLWEVEGIEYSADKLQGKPFQIFSEHVVLAVGAYNRPRTLGIPGENQSVVEYSLPDLDDFLDGKDVHAIDPVVVVGCGLVALDAIIALVDRKIPVIHVFRRDAKDPKIIVNQLPSSYPDYLKMKPLMTGKVSNKYYTPFPRHEVVEILGSNSCVIEHLNGKTCFRQPTSLVLVQIGSKPNLNFMGDIEDLAEDPLKEVDIKENPIDIDPFTYESVRHKGLFAIGPLVGDNFVRFIVGGALGISSKLFKKSGGDLSDEE